LHRLNFHAAIERTYYKVKRCYSTTRAKLFLLKFLLCATEMITELGAKPICHPFAFGHFIVFELKGYDLSAEKRP